MSNEKRARELLAESCRRHGTEPPPGHMLLAPFGEEALPWIVGLAAIKEALSSALQERDGGWFPWSPCAMLEAKLCDGDVIQGRPCDLNLLGISGPTTIVAIRLLKEPSA